VKRTYILSLVAIMLVLYGLFFVCGEEAISSIIGGVGVDYALGKD
jgi:hypothetical protein